MIVICRGARGCGKQGGVCRWRTGVSVRERIRGEAGRGVGAETDTERQGRKADRRVGMGADTRGAGQKCRRGGGHEEAGADVSVVMHR